MILKQTKTQIRLLRASAALMALICLVHAKPLFAQVNEAAFRRLPQERLQNELRPSKMPFSAARPSQNLNALSPEEIEQGKTFLQKLPQGEKAETSSDGDFSENSGAEIPRKNRKILELQVPEARALEDQLEEEEDHSGTKPGEKVPQDKQDAKPDDLETQRSPFEAYLHQETSSISPPLLEAFGYDLFQNVSETFVPLEHFPVSPDYLLGPGDEIRITVWGKIDGDFIKTLDRDGKIILPQLGALHLAGLSFSETRDFIRKAFSRFYKAREVKVNISLGQLRSLRVFTVGKVARPGSYMLSSFSTLTHALFAAGGPSPMGSMRDIQLKRAGKTVTRFDLYNLILKGEKTGDVPLVSGDVIFIPTVGPRVGITGNVNVPARYEIKDPTHLADLIAMAGGIRADGDSQRVQVERSSKGISKIVLDVHLNTLDTAQAMLLQDGDLVKVFSIDDRIKNAVTLKGNVVRPGVFEWVPGMRVRDLFQGSEDFLPETFLDYALIERLIPPDGHKTYLSVALKKALFESDAKANILLHPQDKFVVFQRWDLMEKQQVHLSGAVNRPGFYEYRPNMRLSDLLKLAGGLERSAHPDSYLPEGIVVRKISPGFHEEKISFDFKKTLIHEEVEADLSLHPLDEVYVFDQWTLSQEKTVRIVGAVNAPGIYAWAENMRIKDLLSLAGGTLYYAFLDIAELTRITPTPEGPRIERMSVDMQKVIAGDKAANLSLQRDDYLSIRAVPEWERYRTVRIEGEVRFPGTYTTRKREQLSSLLERAGGLTENAYAKGAVFTRKSVQLLQQRQLDDAINRLEQQMLSHSASRIDTGSRSAAQGLNGAAKYLDCKNEKGQGKRAYVH